MSKATVIIRHEVKDFAAWKSVFDAAQGFRITAGETKADVYRDGNTVYAVLEYATPEQARTYFESKELEQKMGEAGVIGVPQISFVHPA